MRNRYETRRPCPDLPRASRLRSGIRLLLALGLCACQWVAAQTFDPLYLFQDDDGSRPVSELVSADDGLFYGTTLAGGDFGRGSLFKVTSDGALTTVHSFTGADGAFPRGPLVQGPDGALYGTSSAGGASGSGTVLRLTLTGELTTLHHFTGRDGRLPLTGLTPFGGALYGTAARGGRFGAGTLYRLTTGGNFRVLHHFDGNDGAEPAGELTPVGGFLYGTTARGGANDAGTLFKIAPSGAFAALHDFGGPEGSGPRAPLTLGSDGLIYGTAALGGRDESSCIGGCGTLFRSTPDGVVTLFHAFDFYRGGRPLGGVVEWEGRFYGTTEVGGDGCFFLELSIGCGTAYRIDAGGNLEVIHDFDYGVTYPAAGMVLGAEGFLYGSAAHTGLKTDPASFGALYVIDPDPISISDFAPAEAPVGATVAVFGSALDETTAVLFNGVAAEFGVLGESVLLTQVPEGATTGPITIVGDTSSATTKRNFTVTIPGVALTTLKVFRFGEDGTNTPIDALIEASDGFLYGTTLGSGTDGGSIFRISKEGDYQQLHLFPLFGVYEFPWGGLIQASDGNFYGTTEYGGTGGGNLFRMAPDASLTSLYAFTGGDDGRIPRHDGLIEAADGALYGTTQEGAFEDQDLCRFGCGAIFRFVPGEGVTSLHQFTGVDGNSSVSGLEQGDDGLLYGVTNTGGAFDRGVVYKIAPTGEFTLLHDFSGPEGSYPAAKLVQASDGNFYGTTEYGGAFDQGTVFRIAPSGSHSLLHGFSGLDGRYPLAALIEASDGALWGTTNGGGANGFGTIFRITVAGQLTTFHSFGGGDGSYPESALLEASDGALYGTTTRGGGAGCSPSAFQCGTLFRLTLP